MAYEIERALKSETAYKILKEISRTSKGSYPQEISEKIDSHPSTISDIIKTLREEGIVQRGEREKAQYYELNFNGFVDFIYNFWQGKLDEAKNLPATFMDSDESQSAGEYFDSDLQKLKFDTYRGYLIGYFSTVESSTIKSMIYDDFQANLMWPREWFDEDEGEKHISEQVQLRNNIYRALEFNTAALVQGQSMVLAMTENEKSPKDDFMHLARDILKKDIGSD